MLKDWRRIASIEFWLFLFPPWGMWLLWKDPVLTKSTKTRLVLYTIILPILLLIVAVLLQVRLVNTSLGNLGL